MVNYVIHILFGHIFCKVGTANSRVGTGLPWPIRGAAPVVRLPTLLFRGFVFKALNSQFVLTRIYGLEVNIFQLCSRT